METTVKTLGESYEGMLSRDWEKLLGILAAGGKRVLILESAKDKRHYTSSDVYMGPTKAAFLESHCVGWFPTKDDFPAPSVEPAPLEWEKREEVESDIPELDYLEPRYDSPENWLVATDGVFTYNIHIDGFWEIVGMFCDGYLDTTLHDKLAPHENFETAKAQVHEWRVNHLNSMIKK